MEGKQDRRQPGGSEEIWLEVRSLGLHALLGSELTTSPRNTPNRGSHHTSLSPGVATMELLSMSSIRDPRESELRCSDAVQMVGTESKRGNQFRTPYSYFFTSPPSWPFPFLKVFPCSRKVLGSHLMQSTSCPYLGSRKLVSTPTLFCPLGDHPPPCCLASCFLSGAGTWSLVVLN